MYLVPLLRFMEVLTCFDNYLGQLLVGTLSQLVNKYTTNKLALHLFDKFASVKSCSSHHSSFCNEFRLIIFLQFTYENTS